MKIYNEVNYKWEDGKLIETSSDSFEYSGDITLCAKGGNPVGKVLDTTVDYLNKGSDAVHGTVDFLEDTGKKASHMAFGSNVFGEDPDDPISYAAGEDDAKAELGPAKKKDLALAGRAEANQTAGQTASLITG